jgi:CrcB protein
VQADRIASDRAHRVLPADVTAHEPIKLDASAFSAIIAVAVGSALGGVARYLIGSWFLARFGVGFPWGTFFINVTGSFLIGFVAELALSRAYGVTPLVRLFTATGILGGYTTFSTYSLETANLMSQGSAPTAMLYAGGSAVAGVAGVFAGQFLARALVR